MFLLPLVSSVRQRKDELEQRMSTLQESRRELMVQLEQLMMLLKVLQTCLSSIWEQNTLLHFGTVCIFLGFLKEDLHVCLLLFLRCYQSLLGLKLAAASMDSVVCAFLDRYMQMTSNMAR